MSSGPSHYRDAETLMEQADRAALAAHARMEETGEVLDVLPGLIGAVVTLIAAHTHATLAVAAASAQNIRRNGALTDSSVDPAREWKEVLGQ